MRFKATLFILVYFIFNGAVAQELCPVEDVSAFGGDSQNIISWNEPADPFLSTFTVELTTDTYGYETSWDLVNATSNAVIAEEGSDSAGVLTSSTSYSWDVEIESGSYVFTMYDSYGDGLYTGGEFTLLLNGNEIFSFVGETGSEDSQFEEYEISFDTDEGWFGVQSYTYAEPFPFEKGQHVDATLIEGLESNSPRKIDSGSFSVDREIPAACGTFVTYRVYQQGTTNVVLGNSTELEYAHTGLTNGTEYTYYVVAVYDVNGTDIESVPSATASGTPEAWLAVAPTNLLSFPGDEEMLLIWQGPGGGGGGTGTLGENLDNPFIISSMPFSAEGTTVGFENDYDAVCPFTGSTAPDVVYMMTSSGATYDFSLCGNTGYDSKLYILDADGNVVEGSFPSPEDTPEDNGIACNDDGCSSPLLDNYVSSFSGTLPAGLYYVVIDGYSTSSGNYTLDISVVTNQMVVEDLELNETRNRNEYDFLGYNIYVGDAKNNDDIVEFTSYTVSNIVNGTDYTFGVTAVYDGPVGGDNYESQMITVQDASDFIFGDVSGSIKDPNGAPLDSAIVSANGVSDTTGADGLYMLMNLDVGTHVVTVSRNNFSSESISVNILAQAEATVQDFVLSPDMPSPVALSAIPGDEKIYLSWRTPGSVAEYDIAYYDEVLEQQIGCGYGGCSFGVRFTPANYPASLQNIVVSIQGTEYGGGTSAAAIITVYLDAQGLAGGPVGEPVYTLEGFDLSTDSDVLTQFSIDMSEANIEIASGDVYVIVNDGGGFISLANDLEPISPEYFDRNWVNSGAGWSTMANEYYGLAGDFGILAGFIGAPGAAEEASYAVMSVPSSDEIFTGLSYRSISNYNFNMQAGSNVNNGSPQVYVPRSIPTLVMNNMRDEDPELYNVYLVADDLTTTLVSTTTDTMDTIVVSENYNNYCYNIKAQYDTGEPSDGGYGTVESKASNTACAVPFAVGDANFDSETTIEDVLTLVDFILEETTPSNAAFNNSDINMDDELNIADVVMVVDIISGTQSGRSSSLGSFASIEIKSNHASSDLTFNILYDGGLKGLEFDLTYDPNIVSIGEPSLILLQDNVVSTFREIKEGLIKVVLFDVNGGFILADKKHDLLQMPYSFLGSVLDRSSVDISNVIVSGPKGNIASVSSNVVSADVKLVPGIFALHQNYPNPFNPTTEIQFDIPKATQINVSIFNLMGQKVKTLANKQVASGYHVVQWDGTNDNGVSVSTGMYFYTLNTSSQSAMKKMLFLK